MSRPLREIVEELRGKSLPRCQWDSILKINEGGEPPSEDEARTMNEYFNRFLVPNTEMRCVGCGKVQTGILAALVGGFQWGLQHGEGTCVTCGYPARALHYDVSFIQRLPFLLQYHPDELKFNDEEQDGA